MKILLLTILSLVCVSCTDENTYTLYRNSVLDENARYHVASFNSTDGNEYNSGNCQIAMQLFQNQDGVITRFWCEKGKFKK